MMHVLYIKSENYSRARESLRSRRSRELFESARRKGMRKKSARATHASQCHVYIYSLLYALTTIPEILYIALNENLSIYSHKFIRTADLYTHRSSGQAKKCTLNVLFGRPLDTIGP